MRVNAPAGSYDLPARDWYDLSVQLSETTQTWRIAGLGAAVLEAQPVGLSGPITSPAGVRGHLQLYPERRISPQSLDTIAGAYRIPGGQQLLVFGSCGPQADDFDVYYRQGEQVVRLHWIGEQTFLSELAETLQFTPAGFERTSASGQVNQAERYPLYKTETLSIASPQGHTLQGDLLLPAGKPEPFPAVVLVHGAGPEVRQDHLNFASYFLQQGMAVFTYDKRGWGASSGEELWSEVYDLADDAELVLGRLKEHPALNAVGLCGFSNGGWVAPLAATRQPGAAFVIAISGSGVSPACQEQIRRCNVAREVLGASAAQVQQIHHLWEHTFPFLATGEWTEAFEKVYLMLESDAELRSLPRHTGMPDGLQPVPPRRTRAEWLALGGSSPDMLFDPGPVFASLDCPLLCVWGALDSLAPVAESRQALEQALHAHPDFSILLVPGAGHQLFTLPPEDQRPGDEIQRLKKSVRNYAPGVWEQITAWALSHSPTGLD